MIDEVRVIKAREGFPFLCPICKEVDEGKEYLQIFEDGAATPSCVHSSCLLSSLEKQNEVQNIILKLVEGDALVALSMAQSKVDMLPTDEAKYCEVHKLIQEAITILCGIGDEIKAQAKLGAPASSS